jgi:aspartate kinase
MVNSRAIIKFGGADLATGEKIACAARLVVESPYKERVVVVSAMGKTTDTLVGTMKHLGGVSDEDYAEVVSMGERTCARIFASTLHALGVKAEFVDPSQSNFPVITDSEFRDAAPDEKATKAQAQKHLAPILSTGVVPVVCGFLGRDKNGKVTTLGRGGSDTTALLLANVLGANEIVLVKETSGVLSADPKTVPEARFLDKLDIHEAFDLMQGGAKIVKPEALRYKLPNQKLRVVSFGCANLAEGGTEILGSFDLNSQLTEATTDLISINLVCEVNSDNLREAFAALEGKPIYGVSSGKRSITIFTSDGDAIERIRRLHDHRGFKAISHRERVAMVQVSHPSFVDSPGGVARISTALSMAGVNILEVTTSKATINVFIQENKLKSAKEAIENASET